MNATAPTSETSAPAPETPLLKEPPFLALLTGQAASAVGDAVTATALPLLVLALTGSGTQMGIVGMLQTLPSLLLGLPAGALADRWDRRRMMIACDLARAVLVTLIPLSLLLGLPTMWVVLAVVAPLSGFSTLFEAAYFGAVPALVGRPRLRSANGYLSACYGLGVVLGPALAGVLAASIGPANTLLIDALSFIVSALCLLQIRRSLQGERDTAAPRQSMLEEIRGGLRFLYQERALRMTLAFWSLTGLITAPLVPVVSFYVTVSRGLPASSFGAVVSAYAIGSVLGALLCGRLGSIKSGALVLLGTALSGVSMLLLGSVVPLPLLVTIALASGAANSIANVSYHTLRAGLTPDHLVSRVGSASRTVTFGLTPLGMLVGGVLLDVVGGGATLHIMGGLVLAASLCFGLSPVLRSATVSGKAHG